MSDGARFTSSQDALTYLLSGHAIVTLVSRVTGARFTYRIDAPKDSSAPIRFVAVLTGPDNWRDYVYLGLITLGTPPTYRRGVKSSIAPDAPSGLAFSWALRRIAPMAGPGYGELPKDLEIWHEGTCGRCGRRLTTPESIACGIGPECRRKKRYTQC